MAENALGRFLRARREAAAPAGFGLPDGTRRRTPGLRRGEPAVLAGISVEYLTRLERGRDRHPSAQVVGALADALRLSSHERVHVHRLVKAGGATCSAMAAPRPVRPTVPALLDRPEPTPAYVVDSGGDVLACTTGFRWLAERVRPALHRRDRRARRDRGPVVAAPGGRRAGPGLREPDPAGRPGGGRRARRPPRRGVAVRCSRGDRTARHDGRAIRHPKPVRVKRWSPTPSPPTPENQPDFATRHFPSGLAAAPGCPRPRPGDGPADTDRSGVVDRSPVRWRRHAPPGTARTRRERRSGLVRAIRRRFHQRPAKRLPSEWRCSLDWVTCVHHAAIWRFRAGTSR
ncbi:helix-turn-helix domain-containing protein [Saccharothrix espanaensis]|uniref:helix-turn-helix domain-containing protein n=1 Tax=Saccharothrix espanaensis TaxID=103731 RepID=UPI000304AF2F